MFKPEVPSLIGIDEVGKYIVDDNYGFQEKYNGKRRTIFKEGNKIWALNKVGIRREVDNKFTKAIKNLPYHNIVFEAEQVKDVMRVFDLLILEDRALASEPYADRILAAEQALGSQSWCAVAQTALGTEAKMALAQHLIETHAEGIIIKRMDAVYGGQHYKVKFIKTLDAVVLGPSPKGHDSVELGLYDDHGKLIRICGCSQVGKEKVKKGDVIEIIYLYGTSTNHVVQPRMTVKRDDKKPKDCKLNQIVVNKDME